MTLHARQTATRITSVTIDGTTTAIASVTDTNVAGTGTPVLCSSALLSTLTTGHHVDNLIVTAA